jgi:hypothetical protein
VYAFTKIYYTARNRYRERAWNAMTISERERYLEGAKDHGNKHLEFRFAS